MVKSNPKTAKGQCRETEICIAAWMDLLGYGAMLEKSKFEPFDSITRKAINRIDIFHNEIAKTSSKLFPSFVMNDGAVFYKDLSPRSKETSFDFLNKAFNVFSTINLIEHSQGFPGARMVIATGFRVRRRTSIKEHLRNGIAKHIIKKIEQGEMAIEEAVMYSLMTRPDFDSYPELQANFAFSKAYIADAGGSKKGLPGPNCYVDISLFESDLPEWIKFEKLIDWSDRGMATTFGIFCGIDQELARKTFFSGILDAFDVAKRISYDQEILENLKKTKISRWEM